MDHMQRINDNSGIIYIMALGIGMLIITIGTTYLNAMRMDAKIVDNQLQMLERNYYAHAALNHAIGALRELGTGGLNTDFGETYYDFTSDATNDYAFSYNSNDKTCTIKVAGDSMYRNELEVILNDSGFTSAIIAGGEISYTGNSAAITGIINGNVRAYDQFSNALFFITSDFEIAGTVSQSGMASGGAIKIPDVVGNGDLTSTFTPHLDGTIYPGTQARDYMGTEVEFNSYVNGNIVFSNYVQDVTMSGYNIATGDIYLTDNGDNLTLLPDPNNPDFPVLLAGRNIYFNVDQGDLVSGLAGASPLENVYIEGLVYARGNIYIQGVTNVHIKGALVARGDIYINTNKYPATNFVVEYDPMLDPYGFTGGDSGPDHIEIVSWKGHSSD